MHFSIFKNVMLISLLSFFLVSCIERNLNAFEDTAGFYSVYGAIDADSDINYIRIRNTQVPVIEGSREFDADVLFKDIETGEITTLQDTVVDFSGFITHNFILDKVLPAKKVYRLTVERDDGASVSSRVTIPGVTEVLVKPAENVRCNQEIEFTYKNVEYPEQIRLEAGIIQGSEIQWANIGRFVSLEHRTEANEMYLQTTLQNLVFEVFPPPFIEISCNEIRLLHVRYRHLSKEWEVIDEFGQFPPDHSQWMDVENGSGFLGAYREDSLTITVQN